MKTPKVAIVHDWLIGGGAEQVVLELHHIFPDAPIYTSYATPEWRERLDDKVVTGFLQHWPFSKLRKFIPPLRIWWFTHLDLREYDLVISSTGAEAKGVKTRENQIHVCYMHAPTHYYWSRYDQYLHHPGFGIFDPLARLGLKLLVGPLRKWDYKAAQRPNYIIANSTHTQSKIKEYYGRDSEVIFPPVDTERFKQRTENREPRTGFVITGRQTPYKRFDLAVAACTELNLPLAVIGSGPDHGKLKKMAGPTITFLGHVPHSDIPKQLASAQAFIFPGLDDFGIAPVEALASGTPVIAYKAGGALDYIQPGITGEFFTEQTTESLVATLKSFDPKHFDSEIIQSNVRQFSTMAFQTKLSQILQKIS
jgi:glycosyltransferase involved in cell wall biosynthesis